MKVLFLIYSLGAGGAERVTTSLANHMVSLGHDVSIAIMDAAEARPYALDPRIDLICLRPIRRNSSSFNGILNVFRRIRDIRKILKDIRPQLAIGMMTTSAVLLALAGRNSDVVLVGSERTYPPRSPVTSVYRWLRRFSYGWLDHVVAQTREGADWLLQNTRAKSVQVIGNPVTLLPPEPSCPRPDEIIPPESGLVLAVGRLSEEKRFTHLLDAFAAASHGASGWHLAIIGEGPQRDQLQRRIEELGLDGRAYLVGHVGNPRDWLDRADLFAMTSVFEGMPNAMMEALAHSVPVLTYDFTSGPRELVEHGRNGLLVADGDCAALAESMRELMADAGARRHMGAAGAESMKRYTPARIVGEWLELASPGAGAAS